MADTSAAASQRAEYLARVHRVVDYIEHHLGESLSLHALAAVANFSPYHFHRVFTACTGETLYQFILRLRLERAASKAAQQPHLSLTAIALDCGFGSSAAFSRAFRAAYGRSATEWRREVSKKREALRKDGEERPESVLYTASCDPAAPAGLAEGGRHVMSYDTTRKKAAASVRIETLKPTTIGYVRHTGPYAGNEALFGRLFGQLCAWAGPRGLLGPGARFLTVYHDNPEITDEDKLRISVAVTVPPSTAAGDGPGGVGVMELEGGQYAVASYELDPSEYGAAWNWVMAEWLPSSGFQPDDRHCFELMLNDPATHPEHKHVIEIWEPVRPL